MVYLVLDMFSDNLLLLNHDDIFINAAFIVLKATLLEFEVNKLVDHLQTVLNCPPYNITWDSIKCLF